MALFKSRKGGDDAAAAARQPESIDAMRKRARHRLIGAGVLVLIGVVGFPLLFDTQPRPIAVDIPIEIPDRDKAKPLADHARPATQAPTVSGPVTAAVAPAKVTSSAAQASESASAAAPAQPKAETANVAKVEAPAEPKAEAKVEAKVEAKPAAKPDAKVAEAVKAKALLEGKPVAAAHEARYVVQVGAFSDAAKAREVRAKVERAGLKTYTNVADTKEGKRIRVRVGPFETRGEADKAASKIKGLDIQAAILAL